MTFMLLALFILLASFSRSQAFQPSRNFNVVVLSGSTDKSHHRCPRYVYTPEQQQDLDNQEQGQTSSEVLESLLEKLDKSKEREEAQKKDNKAMAFLRKKGKVGGNKDFTNAVGSDEGSGMASPDTDASNAAATPIRKSKKAYKDAIDSGIIDDLSESFPTTSSGSQWRGKSDRIQGGISEGAIRRETVNDKTSNVLVGHVSNDPNAYLQMVVDLSNKANTADGIDASDYDGIELDVLSQEGLQFNVHLRSAKSPQNSYRHTATLECLFGWSTIRIPFSSFKDPDDGSSVDYSSLSRLGIVAMEPQSDVNLAVSGVRFYSVF